MFQGHVAKWLHWIDNTAIDFRLKCTIHYFFNFLWAFFIHYKQVQLYRKMIFLHISSCWRVRFLRNDGNVGYGYVYFLNIDPKTFFSYTRSQINNMFLRKAFSISQTLQYTFCHPWIDNQIYTKCTRIQSRPYLNIQHIVLFYCCTENRKKPRI